MYKIFDSVDDLFELICADKEASGVNSSTLNRYPIRFVLFDNFQSQYDFILRMINELKVGYDTIDSWFDEDYPDILITHYKLAQELDRFIKSLDGKSRIVTPFSEVARFYDNADNKEFDALIKTIKGYESSKMGWDKHQRVYIPIVGLEAKMSVFKDDQQIFLWYVHSETSIAEQRLILTNNPSYYVSGFDSSYTRITSVAEWIGLWKQKDAYKKPNILCDSESLFANAGFAKPDNAFDVIVCNNAYEYLTKGFQLFFPNVEYKDEELPYWEKMANDIDLTNKFDFHQFVCKHFSVIEIDSYKTFAKLWFESENSYDRWLMVKEYMSSHRDDYLCHIVSKLDCSNKLELFNIIALDLSSSEEDIQCRRFFLDGMTKKDYRLTDETISKMLSSLEKIAATDGYKEAVRYFTHCTQEEKSLAISWIGKGLLSRKDVTVFYPELVSYLDETNVDVKSGTEWVLDYIDKYKKSKIAGRLEPNLQESLSSLNSSPVEFIKWYQGFKTTRSMLASRKDIDVFYWIDGLGIDWINLICELIRKHNQDKIFLNEVYIARAMLPSITEVNKADLQKLLPEGQNLEKIGNLDEIAHTNTNTYPHYIVKELDIVTNAVSDIIQKYAGKKIAIVSDHGLSYTAQYGTGMNLGGYEYHHFGRYATTLNGSATSDNKYYILDDNKTICSLTYDSVGNRTGSGQGAHGGCTPEEVLVPIFIISSSPNKKYWKAKALDDCITGTSPFAHFRIIGLEDGDKPELKYNGSIYGLKASDDNMFVSQEITNLEQNHTSFVVKVGENEEIMEIKINTGSVMEDQFADFF